MILGEPNALPARAPTKAEQPYLGLADAVADSKKAKAVRREAYLHTKVQFSFPLFIFIIIFDKPFDLNRTISKIRRKERRAQKSHPVQSDLEDHLTTDHSRLKVTNGSSSFVDDLVRLDFDGTDVTPKPSKKLTVDLTGPVAESGQVIKKGRFPLF